MATSKKSDALGTENEVTLTTKFDMEDVGGELSDIQEIIVGGVATPPPTIAEPDNSSPSTVDRVSEVTQHGQIDTGRNTGWATARKILSELLGGDANVTPLMESVPADAELNVQVHIGFKKKAQN